PGATTAAAKAWATREGMQVVFVSHDGSYLLLAGTAAQAERTFSVELRTFRVAGTTFYANVDPPTVPASVDGVIGLNDKLGARLFDHRPAQDTCAGSECTGLTTPQDLWSAYDQPADLANAKADFGQGQQMAVLGEGAVAGPLADLRTFEHEFGLPQLPVTVKSVGDDFKDTSGSGEWDIDTQASTGMAPKAFGETLYFAKDLGDSSVLADFQAWSGDSSGPLQANASFGECEQDPTSQSLEPKDNDAAYDGVLAGPAGVQFTQGSEHALEEATVQGKSLFAATGDTGSSCPELNVNVNGVGNEVLPETNYPASSRYVVAVGGTVLYTTPNTASSPKTSSNAQRAQETAWTFTGGGNTFYVPEPSYQHGIALLDGQPCVSQPDGTPYSTSTPCRGVPDVAAQSGDVISNGYATTMGGTPDSAGGGTSLASPLWVGMWTRVQAAGKTSTLGFADPALYKIGLDTAKDPGAFFDIGNGGPSSPVTGNGYYASLPRNPVDPSGWDYVSGLGSPDLTKLAVDATGNATLTPRDNVAAPAAQDCGQPGLPACPIGGSTGSCAAGGPLWSNQAHTATDALGNQDPQLSLLAGNISGDGKTLRLTLEVTNLTTDVPPGATGEAWYAEWQDAAGTTHFASAEAGPGAIVDYGDGTYSSGTGYQEANTDTGKMTPGPNGVVEIDVPYGNVGLKPGAVLSQPAGKTYTEEGVPPSPAAGSTGLLAKVDTGGPGCTYTAP
ncbi:MAG: hypothetical protein JOZ41_09335, partial [Chloroflexi bacterium]|nr:hypothetical protein [Chloroflexota bacterium]